MFTSPETWNALVGPVLPFKVGFIKQSAKSGQNSDQSYSERIFKTRLTLRLNVLFP